MSENINAEYKPIKDLKKGDVFIHTDKKRVFEVMKRIDENITKKKKKTIERRIVLKLKADAPIIYSEGSTDSNDYNIFLLPPEEPITYREKDLFPSVKVRVWEDGFPKIMENFYEDVGMEKKDGINSFEDQLAFGKLKEQLNPNNKFFVEPLNIESEYLNTGYIFKRNGKKYQVTSRTKNRINVKDLETGKKISLSRFNKSYEIIGYEDIPKRISKRKLENDFWWSYDREMCDKKTLGIKRIRNWKGKGNNAITCKIKQCVDKLGSKNCQIESVGVALNKKYFNENGTKKKLR